MVLVISDIEPPNIDPMGESSPWKFSVPCPAKMSFPKEDEKAEFMANVQNAVNKDYYVG